MSDGKLRLKDIAAIREQIASGQYVTEGKLRVVADRLLRGLRDDGHTSQGGAGDGRVGNAGSR